MQNEDLKKFSELKYQYTPTKFNSIEMKKISERGNMKGVNPKMHSWTFLVLVLFWQDLYNLCAHSP